MSPRRGAAAIEFALIVPILFMIFAGIIDVSRYITMVHLLSRTARDAARAGSMVIEGSSPTGDEIEAAAVAQGRALLSAANYACTGTCNVTADWRLVGAYRYVVVDVTYPFAPVMGTLPTLHRDIHATFTMMSQQQ